MFTVALADPDKFAGQTIPGKQDLQLEAADEPAEKCWPDTRIDQNRLELTECSRCLRCTVAVVAEYIVLDDVAATISRVTGKTLKCATAFVQIETDQHLPGLMLDHIAPAPVHERSAS